MAALVRRGCHRKFLPADFVFIALIALAVASLLPKPLHAQTPSPALLVLEKDDSMLAVVDPTSFKVIGRVAAGSDPHEVAVSSDGKTAYITNYGAFRTPLRTLSVVDLTTLQARTPVELGALLAPHGIENVGGKIYFTAEGSKRLRASIPLRRRWTGFWEWARTARICWWFRRMRIGFLRRT
jgi:hypothetical protein